MTKTDNNTESFEQVYNKYFDALYYYALGFADTEAEAKDMVQDAFLYYYRNRNKISSNVKSYLFTSIRNAGINIIQHREVKKKYEDRSAFEDSAVDYEFSADMEDKITAIKTILQDIPEKTRKVFLLSAIEGMKYKEIAQEIGISEHTVKFHISKALKMLKERVEVSPEYYLAFLLFLKDL